MVDNARITTKTIRMMTLVLSGGLSVVVGLSVGVVVGFVVEVGVAVKLVVEVGVVEPGANVVATSVTNSSVNFC